MKEMKSFLLVTVFALIVITGGFYVMTSDIETVIGRAICNPSCDVNEDGAYNITDLIYAEGSYTGSIPISQCLQDNYFNETFDNEGFNLFVTEHINYVLCLNNLQPCDLIGDVNGNGKFAADDLIDVGRKKQGTGGVVNTCVDLDANGSISDEEFMFFYYYYLISFGGCELNESIELNQFLQTVDNVMSFNKLIMCIDYSSLTISDYLQITDKLEEVYDVEPMLSCSASPISGEPTLFAFFNCTVENGVPPYILDWRTVQEGNSNNYAEQSIVDSNMANNFFNYEYDIVGTYDWSVILTDSKDIPNEVTYSVDGSSNPEQRIFVVLNCTDNDGDGYGGFGGTAGCAYPETDCDDNDDTVYPGAEELCDNKDNDCNTVIDAFQQECGPDTTLGECKMGNQTCSNGLWGACSGVYPQTEKCTDKLDNDCDGKIDMVDEDCGGCVNGTTRNCTGNSVGECTPGEQTCVNNKWGSCTGAVYPESEICDNKDNDCDGNIDQNLIRVCGNNIGECIEGSQICSNGVWGSCSGIVPVVELCNSRDDDCDGLVDEEDNTTPLRKPCYNGPSGTLDIGECAEGYVFCRNAVWETNCTGEITPVDEICNNTKDDDCDGRVDEGCACTDGMSRECGTNVGICLKGVQVCFDGDWGNCTGGIMPDVEICDDFKDNDCDNKTDEGCEYCDTGEKRVCGTDVGECVEGVEECIDNEWGECVGVIEPDFEICDGLDNDCDGSTDEGFNLDTDEINCGGCGIMCSTSEICSNGFCVTDDVSLAVGTAQNVLPQHPNYQEQEAFVEQPGSPLLTITLILIGMILVGGAGFAVYWFTSAKTAKAVPKTEELSNYIANTIKAGYPKKQIYDGLLKQGWPKKTLDNAFSKIR